MWVAITSVAFSVLSAYLTTRALSRKLFLKLGEIEQLHREKLLSIAIEVMEAIGKQR